MSKLVCMGELLIDFQAKGAGTLKDASLFVKKAGGAPANVCVQAVKLGVNGVYLTQVGGDEFGAFLIDTLKNEGVDVSHVKTSPDYDTSLAFVSFDESGEREFAFYRRTAADLYLNASDFDEITFTEGDVFEFGSVALKTEQARKAHDAVIDRARRANALVCFDPNLRFDLWDSRDELKSTVKEYAKKADVIKLGADELAFLTDGARESKAADNFMRETGARLLAVTCGADGARLCLRDGRRFAFDGYKVKTVDTTGAGDSFFGGMIAELMRMKVTKDTLADEHDYNGLLRFACRCGSYTTTNYGAISAMGTRKEIEEAVK